MPYPKRINKDEADHIQRIAVMILELALSRRWGIVTAIDAVSDAARKLNNEYLSSLAERKVKK